MLRVFLAAACLMLFAATVQAGGLDDLKAANAAAEQGKTDDAIRTFSELTEDYPELPEPYNNLAVLYAGQGQYDKARIASSGCRRGEARRCALHVSA